MNPPFTGTVKILRATATDVGVRGIATDIRAVMPTALAFPVRAGLHDDIVRRSNEDKAQIIVERPQQLEAIPGRMHFDLGLQGRTYFPRSAQGFDFFLDFR